MSFGGGFQGTEAEETNLPKLTNIGSADATNHAADAAANSIHCGVRGVDTVSPSLAFTFNVLGSSSEGGSATVCSGCRYTNALKTWLGVTC